MAATDVFTFHFVNGPEVIAMGTALPIVCFLAVSLRLYTRRTQRVEIGADDWLIVGGLLCVIGMGACLVTGAKGGAFGYPTPTPPADLTDAELLEYLDPSTYLGDKIEFAYQILLVMAYGLIKLSIVFFYRRLFVPRKGTAFDIASGIVAVVVLIWTVAFVLIIIFPCGRHVWANWGSEEDYLTLCPIVFTSLYGLVISDLILDIFVITLPLPLIWKLHLTPKKKLAVTGIILLGASAIGASMTRLVLYVQELKAFAAGIALDNNQSLTLGCYWSMLEGGLALIAACLPTLSYFFTHSSTMSFLRSISSAFSPRSSRSRSSREDSSVPGSAICQRTAYTKLGINESIALQARRSSLSCNDHHDKIPSVPKVHLMNEMV